MSTTSRINLHLERLERATPDGGSAVAPTAGPGADRHTARLLRRIRWMEATLVLTLMAIGANLLTALALAARWWITADAVANLPVLAFVSGLLLLFAAVVTSIVEMAQPIRSVVQR